MNHRHVTAYLLAATAALVMHSPAVADQGPPDFTAQYPAGMACSDFGLQVEVWNGQGKSKDLGDHHGKHRTLNIGRGGAFRYTNMLTGKQASSEPQGTLQLTTTFDADGSQKVTVLGSLLLIWFPTDIPAGPSTTFYDRGLVSFKLSPDGVGTLLKSKGASLDVCAALS